MSENTVEQRLTALEVAVKDVRDFAAGGFDLLHNLSFPELDKEIDVIRQQGYDVATTARKSYDDALVALNEASTSIRNFTADVKNTEISLAGTISGMLTRNGSAALIAALIKALKSVVLITRPASRDEAKSPDTLVVRQATREELKAQN
jgi:hypothetical protein